MGESTDGATDGAAQQAPEWRVVVTRAAHEFRIHQCWDMAAALTYHAVLSVCPALLAATAFIGLFGSAEPVARGALDVVRELGGDDTVAALTEPVDQLLGASQAGHRTQSLEMADGSGIDVPGLDVQALALAGERAVEDVAIARPGICLWLHRALSL